MLSVVAAEILTSRQTFIHDLRRQGHDIWTSHLQDRTLVLGTVFPPYSGVDVVLKSAVRGAYEGGVPPGHRNHASTPISRDTKRRLRGSPTGGLPPLCFYDLGLTSNTGLASLASRLHRRPQRLYP